MKVKIKTWEQMEQEFGTYPNGDICTEQRFGKSMEKLLPIDRIIEVCEDEPDNEDDVGDLVWWVDKEDHIDFFVITEDMIEEYV